SRQVLPRRLGEIPTAVDAVHDLHGSVLVRLEVCDELDELLGLPIKIEVVKGLKREGRVPHPTEAVVPVALPARRLRQRGGQRRDRRSRRGERQTLDRQRRTLD